MDVTNGNEIHHHSVFSSNFRAAQAKFLGSQGQISRYGETINLPVFTTHVPSTEPSTGKCLNLPCTT